MTVFVRQKILTKLDSLNEYLGYLRQLRKESRSEKLFVTDFHLFGLTERYLQLSIQIMLDCVHLIIIDLGLKRPADNYEAIAIIFRHKLIPERLADTMTQMIGLRNILVHEYSDVDRKTIYRILKNQIKDLENFKKHIVKFLKVH